MTSGYDFTDITPTQAALLTYGGWQVSDARVRPQPSKRTVAKLIDRGLITVADVPQRGGYSVLEYDVPIAVHIAWCNWCSRKAP